MCDIMEFVLTFVIDYNPTDKLYRGWCEEFPDLKVENAATKLEIIQQIWNQVAQNFGGWADSTYSIRFRKK
jgi:hypothetical protein